MVQNRLPSSNFFFVQFSVLVAAMSNPNRPLPENELSHGYVDIPPFECSRYHAFEDVKRVSFTCRPGDIYILEGLLRGEVVTKRNWQPTGSRNLTRTKEGSRSPVTEKTVRGLCTMGKTSSSMLRSHEIPGSSNVTFSCRGTGHFEQLYICPFQFSSIVQAAAKTPWPVTMQQSMLLPHACLIITAQPPIQTTLHTRLPKKNSRWNSVEVWCDNC